MVDYKDAACAVFAGIGAWIAQLYGGWTSAMTALIVFIAVDIITGLLCGIAKKSPHTENGGLSSKVMREGAIKKVEIFFILLIAAWLDIAMHVTIWKDAACLYYIAEEGLSIIENAGSLGLPFPEKLKNAIEALKNDKQ